MNTVKVSRNELLKAITKNRELHQNEFNESEASYRAAAIKELEKMLTEAKDNKLIRRHLGLPEPESHVEDYDREIKMLQMSVDDVIELTAHDFERYIMDNWEWKRSVAATNAFYKASIA